MKTKEIQSNFEILEMKLADVHRQMDELRERCKALEQKQGIARTVTVNKDQVSGWPSNQSAHLFVKEIEIDQDENRWDARGGEIMGDTEVVLRLIYSGDPDAYGSGGKVRLVELLKAITNGEIQIRLD